MAFAVYQSYRHGQLEALVQTVTLPGAVFVRTISPDHPRRMWNKKDLTEIKRITDEGFSTLNGPYTYDLTQEKIDKINADGHFNNVLHLPTAADLESVSLAPKRKSKLNKDETRNIQHQLAAIEIDVASFTDAGKITITQLKEQVAGRLALIADALDIEQKSPGLLK